MSSIRRFIALQTVLAFFFFYFSTTTTCFRVVPSISRSSSRFRKMLLNSGGKSNQDLHDEEQWEMFIRNSAGYWKGIQTGYDPSDDQVEDFMYTEVNMCHTKTETLDELVQTNSFVAGEIRADCEVCYDSERLKSKEVGKFTVGKMKNVRVCGNVDLRGPAPTPRGLSTELSFRHDDSRLRVLLAYKPIDFQEVQNVGMIPSALGLSDIVVVRERIEKRPLKLDQDPDSMWRPTTNKEAFDKFSKQGFLSGSRRTYNPSGLEFSDRLPNLTSGLSPLKKCDGPAAAPGTAIAGATGGGAAGAVAASAVVVAAAAEEDDDVYRRVLPGGIYIEVQHTHTHTRTHTRTCLCIHFTNINTLAHTHTHTLIRTLIHTHTHPHNRFNPSYTQT